VRARDVLTVVPQVGHRIEITILEGSVERLVRREDVFVVFDHEWSG
jgi:hypothetical protein